MITLILFLPYCIISTGIFNYAFQTRSHKVTAFSVIHYLFINITNILECKWLHMMQIWPQKFLISSLSQSITYSWITKNYKLIVCWLNFDKVYLVLFIEVEKISRLHQSKTDPKWGAKWFHFRYRVEKYFNFQFQ